MVEVSVVLPSYIRNNHKASLASLVKQNVSSNDFEVLVVKNGSNKDNFFREGNISTFEVGWSGLNRARNFAVQESKAGIVAFLDDDAVADTSWVKSIIRSHEKHNEPVIGGKVLPKWPVTGKPFWVKGILLDYLSLLDYSRKVTVVHPLDWVAGTNMSIKKIIFERVGYFDEEIGRNGSSLLSSDEEELFRRIRGLDMNILYDPAIKVWHIIPESRLRANYFIQRAYWQGASDYMMDRKDKSAREIEEIIRGKSQTIGLPNSIGPEDVSTQLISLCEASCSIGYLQQALNI